MLDKEKIKKAVADPRFISGIYNYCDRWCEKCPFTSKCANFNLLENELEANPDDEVDESFWDSIHEMCEVTMDMLKEIAEEKGIDLDSLDSEEFSEQQEMIEEKIKDNSCARGASTYITMVDEWLESADSLLSEKEEELNLKAEVDLLETDAAKEAEEINEALEILQRYKHQIYIKLMRAIKGDISGDYDESLDFPRDADGSAKVSLVCIDRSIASWGVLYKRFPSRENEIIDVLVHLDRLRRSVENDFPQAREFIKPGFDAQPLQENPKL
jgi:hypothetical protein